MHCLSFQVEHCGEKVMQPLYTNHSLLRGGKSGKKGKDLTVYRRPLPLKKNVKYRFVVV